MWPSGHLASALREVLWQRVGKFLLKSTDRSLLDLFTLQGGNKYNPLCGRIYLLSHFRPWLETRNFSIRILKWIHSIESYNYVQDLILYIGQILPFHWSVTAVDEAIHYVWHLGFPYPSCVIQYPCLDFYIRILPR